MSTLIKEFCAENYTDIPLAIHRGAKRIELCDNLAVGGTTPSTGVLEEAISYCNEKQVRAKDILSIMISILKSCILI